MSLLEVKSVSKIYGKGNNAVHALKDIKFSVDKGEYIAIVGESGSGKSTLLNIIGALDTFYLVSCNPIKLERLCFVPQLTLESN